MTACNDGARKMERTEQLHEIYKKLYFGKLKPIPLVSVSRQLERRGTLALLTGRTEALWKEKDHQETTLSLCLHRLCHHHKEEKRVSAICSEKEHLWSVDNKSGVTQHIKDCLEWY